MLDPFDMGYIVFVSIVLICFTGFFLWLWRGRFLPGRSVWGAIRMSFPPLGLLGLNAADRVLDLCHLSPTRHAFWSGMFVASDLWLMVLMVANVTAAVRRFQADRADPHCPEARYRT